MTLDSLFVFKDNLRRSNQSIELILAQVGGQVRKIDLLEVEEEGEMIAIDRPVVDRTAAAMTRAGRKEGSVLHE